ncbi:MAG: SUMF1/EgtB/PvdO family nonheme iron enzyme [Puniceicoccales bacterium]|nr:SUMF1/EgtB/PvdO family nonheme iron enzyme [Puniceicoccales bacterium]
MHKLLSRIRIFAVSAGAFALAATAATAATAYDNGSVPVNTPDSARRLINDLLATHGEKGYPRGKEFLARLDALEKANPATPTAAPDKAALVALIREAALANPALDFDRILFVRRKPGPHGVGFMQLNSHSEDGITRTGWDNEIVLLSNLRAAAPALTPIYRHPGKAIMRDLDLHFDADRFLFATVNANGDWGVFEKSLATPAAPPRELTPNDQRGIQWFDPCYLPEEGAILAFSTAGVQGVPCENGGYKVSSLYRVENKPTTTTTTTATASAPHVRQLTFEQDSGWHPRTLNDGRVMYLRWQYTDTPHYFDRMLFTMLPDGRQQKALWGSGAYFPTAYKHARPVPGHPSMVLGVAGSHHGLAEQGRLLLVDPNLGTHYPFRHAPKTKQWGPEGAELEIPAQVYPASVTGCVQEIPGWGRDVVGNVKDGQGENQTYTFATPFPINEKYFLTSIRLRGQRNFAIYLADRFDNLVKLYEIPGENLFEPTPLIPRKRPPVIPDFVAPALANAAKSAAAVVAATPAPTAPAAAAPAVGLPHGTMLVTDVYDGRGLPEIPRGAAKSIRVIAYHFAFWRRGGHHSVGEHSSWDIKRILGTVPIEADGSAFFKVPANTPVALQVLDADGAAIQLMQSWTIAMPGEGVACAGCHESSNTTFVSRRVLAANKPPRELTPFYGPERPFSFETEIQPLLDRHCVGCHSDANAKALPIPSFIAHRPGEWQRDTAYRALHPYVRRPGPETFIETKVPMEFHVSGSELIQRLRRGHFGVEKRLDREAWERLYAWIDLNAPYRGAWNEANFEKLRLDLQLAYLGNTYNSEEAHRRAKRQLAANPVPQAAPVSAEKLRQLLAASRAPASVAATATATAAPVHFASVAAAAAGAGAAAELPRLTLTLASASAPDAPAIAFRRIPAGTVTLGSPDGFSDERPLSPVRIAKPYWIAETEITNAQYAAFDPVHDTGYTVETGKDHVAPGHIANHPDQPVARISWRQAMDYCQWLSKKTGKRVTLPTEAQWEHAARAGSATTFHFGPRDADFSAHANLADAGLRRTSRGYPGGSRIGRRSNFPNGYPFPLRDDRFADKWFTVDYVRQYAPNAWGLYDTIGNVWEWTRTSYAPYPYRDNDGRNDLNPATKKVARGGSHADRPRVIGSAVRLPYEAYQKVHNVGFRPIIEE